MKGMKMLDLDRIRLEDVAEALESHSYYDTCWWFDPSMGTCEPFASDMLNDDEIQDPEQRGMVPVEPLPSNQSYRDMHVFAAQVREPRARELLLRAIEGRGAFRRFKDTLLEFPELRAAWFDFHGKHMNRRAIEWLLEQGFVSERNAARATAASEPRLDGPLFGHVDVSGVIDHVAAELKDLYGDRLRQIVLFGSWARGDAGADSDVDLLVVLDRVDDRLAERRRMDDLLWRHTLESGVVITTLPVAQSRYDQPDAPVLVRARAEGRVVA